MNQAAPKHAPAKTWLDAALSADDLVGFAWVVLLAFLRIATRAGPLPRPLPLDQAAEIVAAWLGTSTAVVIHPTDRHLEVMRGLLAPLSTAGDLVTDAHLAALAVEHGGEIVSFDTDFARFSGLRWSVPPG